MSVDFTQPDLTHTLLPRSTGLHYSLRSLASRIPDLRLIDVTVAYPGAYKCCRENPTLKLHAGIPPLHYGQDYYTLRSVFFDGVAPPLIHLHLRMFHVIRDVPIGDLSSSRSSTLPKHSDKHTVEVDIPEVEKAQFDSWLRRLWEDKDRLIDKFHETQTFKGAPVEIPLRLRRKREVLDAFCFFLPAAVGYAWRQFVRDK